jgi:hypothetical protein
MNGIPPPPAPVPGFGGVQPVTGSPPPPEEREMSTWQRFDSPHGLSDYYEDLYAQKDRLPFWNKKLVIRTVAEKAVFDRCE